MKRIIKTDTSTKPDHEISDSGAKKQRKKPFHPPTLTSEGEMQVQAGSMNLWQKK